MTPMPYSAVQSHSNMVDAYSDCEVDDDGPFIVAPPPTPDIPEPECCLTARRNTVAIRPPTPDDWEDEDTEDAYATYMDGPHVPPEDEAGDGDTEDKGDEVEDEEEEEYEDEEVAPAGYVMKWTHTARDEVPFARSCRSDSSLSDSLSPPETPSPPVSPNPPGSLSLHASHCSLTWFTPIEFAFYNEMRGQGIQLSQLCENPEQSANLMVQPDERVFWKHGLFRARLCCSVRQLSS